MAFYFTTTGLNAIFGIQMVGSLYKKSCAATMSISRCTLLTLYSVLDENCGKTCKAGVYRIFSCPKLNLVFT